MNTIGQQQRICTIAAAFLAVAVLTPPVCAATREYTRIETGYHLTDINNLGQATGPGAIFWQNGNTTLLGSLEGPGDWSNGIAISDTGFVVGDSRWYHDSQPLQRAFMVTPEDTTGDGVPDRWHRDSDGDGLNDLMTDLGARLVGGQSFAADVNSFGQTVGWSENQAFVWHDGVMVDLGPETYFAYGINDMGQVVGGARDGAFLINPEDSDGDGVPDRWWRDADSNGSNDLMTLIGGDWGVDINEHGQVLVQLQSYAVLWTPDTPNGMSGSGVSLDSYPLTPIKLNNSGQAIAWSPGDFVNQGVLWENGALVDITPIPSLDYIPELYAINDAGWIVAEYGNLFIPAAVPEPGALMLSILAASLFTWRRRRCVHARRVELQSLIKTGDSNRSSPSYFNNRLGAWLFSAGPISATANQPAIGALTVDSICFSRARRRDRTTPFSRSPKRLPVGPGADSIRSATSKPLLGQQGAAVIK